MVVYIAKDGETLDFICWLYYGKTEGVVEQVLKANRPLAELPPILSAGTKITLPAITDKKNKQRIKLWQ